jgi:phage terminase small subunit
MPLNHKQRLFVKEYLIDQNGTRAALAAGYSSTDKGAGVQATRLLAKPSIKSAVYIALRKREDKVEFRADDVLREIKNIADADIALCYTKDGDIKPLHKIPKRIRKAIAGIEVQVLYAKRNGKRVAIGATKKLKFWDKTKALEMYGRHQKLFSDRVALENPDGSPIQPAAASPVVVILPPKNEK